MPEHTPAPTPARAVYGFALHLTFRILFVVYVLWATVPEDWFRALGFTYLPQRYWAIALPVLILTIIAAFAFFIYPSLGLLMTPEWDELRTVTDGKAIKSRVTRVPHGEKRGCVCGDETRCGKARFDGIEDEEFVNNSVPSLQDLNVIRVSEHLYL